VTYVQRWFLLAAPAALLVASAVTDPRAQTAKSTGGVLLYPVPRSVVKPGPVLIVAATPTGKALSAARLNGKRLALRKMLFDPEWQTTGLLPTSAYIGSRSGTTLYCALVSLGPGAHMVQLGARKVQLLAGVGSRLPPGWTRWYVHPPNVSTADNLGCGTCHEVKDSRLGPVALPERCAPCHSDTAVQVIHKHVTPPLARCAMCHDPHGSSRARLLTDSKEKLCTRCHAGGHSKS